MSIRLISITTMIPARNGFAWWPCEIETPDSVASESDAALVDYVFDKLLSNGILRATRLELNKLDSKHSRVFKRRPIAITRAMIGAVSALHIELVEADQVYVV